MNTVSFDPTKVTKIYLGKDRHCRCGCGGEYVERDHPMFAKRLKRFQSMWSKYEPNLDQDVTDVDDSYLNISYATNSALTVYFD